MFIVFLFLFSVNRTEAQDTSQTLSGFPFGVFSHIATDPSPNVSIQLMQDAGINWISDRINDTTGSSGFNMMGHKLMKQGEWIFYYAKGYYSKWEAERDTFDFNHTGFKHPHDNGDQTKGYLYGSVETHPSGAVCWATDSSLGFKVDSVLWGPNYHQDKNYSTNENTGKIEYTASYRLALNYDPSDYAETDTVCRLAIHYRYYVEQNGVIIDTLEEDFADTILTIADFSNINQFNNYKLKYNYSNEFVNKSIKLYPMY